MFENLHDWSIYTCVAICSPAPAYVNYNYRTVMSNVFFTFYWERPEMHDKSFIRMAVFQLLFSKNGTSIMKYGRINYLLGNT